MEPRYIYFLSIATILLVIYVIHRLTNAPPPTEDMVARHLQSDYPREQMRKHGIILRGLECAVVQFLWDAASQVSIDRIPDIRPKVFSSLQEACTYLEPLIDPESTYCVIDAHLQIRAVKPNGGKVWVAPCNPTSAKPPAL